MCRARTIPRIPIVGYNGLTTKKGDSAARLLVPSFSETLARAQGSKSRVVTFSLKARSAIMLAGHHADVAAWFADPGWLTSSSVVSSVRPEIERYLKDHPVENDRGKTWTKLLPEADYKFTDEAIGEQPPGGKDGTFPHPLTKPGEKPEELLQSLGGQPVLRSVPRRARRRRGRSPEARTGAARSTFWASAFRRSTTSATSTARAVTKCRTCSPTSTSRLAVCSTTWIARSARVGTWSRCRPIMESP